jgi:hypothetical protein
MAEDTIKCHKRLDQPHECLMLDRAWHGSGAAHLAAQVKVLAHKTQDIDILAHCLTTK